LNQIFERKFFHFFRAGFLRKSLFYADFRLYTMSLFMSQNMSWKCRIKVCYNGISGNYAKAKFKASPEGGAFSMRERVV